MCNIYGLYNFFARPLIVFLGGDGEEVISQAAAYMSASSLGMIFMTGKWMLMKIVRSYGMNVISFVTQIVSMAGNVIFSVLLIMTTNLGIAALGLGSAIAAFLEVLFMIIIIIKRKQA